MTAVLFLIIGLAGCKVGPDYEAPDAAKQSPSIVSADTADATSAGIALGQPIVSAWWTTLRDPKLDALVAALVESNLDLRTAEARVREARAQRVIAAGPLYPRLTINGSVGVGGTNDKLHGSIVYDASAGTAAVGANAVWQLDVFGGIRRSVEAADRNFEAAIESRRDQLVVVLAELGRTYVQLRGAQRQLAIASRNVALQDRTIQLITTLRRAGLVSEVQLAQAEAQLESTRAALPSLEADVTTAAYALSVLVGRPPPALLAELAEPAPLPAVPPVVPIGLPSELIQRRPDVRRAERAMAAATAQKGVATADLYPKFALTGVISYGSNGGRDGTPSFFVGPNVTWPVFRGYEIVANIDLQDARLEQAVLAYRSSLLRAFQEVETSLVDYAKERVRRDTLVKAARQAARGFELAQTQFRNGLVDFLYVLTAQGQQLSSELALAVSEQTLLTNLVQVYKSLGGGWDVFDPRVSEREAGPASTELPK